MIWLAVLLVIAWLLGWGVFHVAGGLIHILLVIALVVIGIFMKYISKGSFMPFVIYRVALGALILILLSTGVLEANSATTAAAAVGGAQ